MRILLGLLVAVIITGCATTGQLDLLDFNSRYNQQIPTSPQFKIEKVTVNRYQIVVYQGSPLISEVTTRSAYLTKAAYFAMEHQCIEIKATLGEHQIRDNVDGWGYVNLLGFFKCTAVSDQGN